MADVAQGRPCKVCGTLVTYSGSFSDPELSGACARCGMAGEGGHNTIPNPRYVPRSDEQIENDRLKAELESYRLREENAQLREELDNRKATEAATGDDVAKALKLGQAENPTVPPPGTAIEEGKHSPELVARYTQPTDDTRAQDQVKQ